MSGFGARCIFELDAKVSGYGTGRPSRPREADHPLDVAHIATVSGYGTCHLHWFWVKRSASRDLGEPNRDKSLA